MPKTKYFQHNTKYFFEKIIFGNVSDTKHHVSSGLSIAKFFFVNDLTLCGLVML